ncbi:TRAP transporter substrate-binding protein DctP [Nesterenkonia ebinurensis]|uniref:TRAP transporter substrate-binding protein DctP n=1 Tax=Nesterenkonia ebinurensis TaxID=2608252 RepID=UPI00123CA1A7|nr:TRAP transporter substrate-binding protein DctP [Nesterenkonia ebinurensis]
MNSRSQTGRTRKSTGAAILVLVAMAGLAACGGGNGGEDNGGDEEQTLRFGHYQARGPAVEGEGRLADAITESENNSLTIDVGWSESYGAAGELADLVQAGALDIGLVVTHYGVEGFPIHALQTAGFWTSDSVEGLETQRELVNEVFNSDPFEEELESHNQVGLLHQALAPYYLVSPEPGCSLEDLQGARVRSLGETYPAALGAIGATPVSLTAAEFYESIERGNVDYLTVAAAHIVSQDLHEVAPYACGPIFWLGNGHTTTMNLDVWNSLSEEEQEDILSIAEETQDWYFENAIQEEENLVEELSSEGMTFESFPEKDLQEWIEQAPDSIEWWSSLVEDSHPDLDVGALAEQVREITEF